MGTVGDCVVINYNSKTYEIEIVECKPANAISIIEADVNVDFAPPKDYKEPERQPAAVQSASLATKVEDDGKPPEEEPKSMIFSGAGQRVDGKAIKTPQSSPNMGPAAPPAVEDESVTMPWKHRIKRGVKHVVPPYGYGIGHMSGQKGAAPPPPINEDVFKGAGNTLM